MGQQFPERAAATFAEAFKKDPKLVQAAVNEGIALMALQKLDEAKAVLNQAIALDPRSRRRGTTSVSPSMRTTKLMRR